MMNSKLPKRNAVTHKSERRTHAITRFIGSLRAAYPGASVAWRSRQLDHSLPSWRSGQPKRFPAISARRTKPWHTGEVTLDLLYGMVTQIDLPETANNCGPANR